MSKLPWIKRHKKTDPDIPLRSPFLLSSYSNGEIFHQQTKLERKMEKEILRRADETSRKLGMDRREYLASTMGFATSLAVVNLLNGCSGSGDDGTSKGLGTGGSGGSGAGGAGGGAGGSASDVAGFCGEPADTPYIVPVEATCEPSSYLSSQGEFIMDIQTHSFDQGEWRDKNPGYAHYLSEDLGGTRRLLGPCDATDTLDCYDRDYYGELMFVDSDTTMAVITSWPAHTCTDGNSIGCGLPLSNDDMRELRDWINSRAMSERVVNQVQVMPNDRWPLQKDIMTRSMEDPAWRAVSWKCYPAWKSESYRPQGLPAGYFLNEPIGEAFIQHGLDLCIPNFAIHKGLSIPGFDVEHNQTIDVGPAAKNFPDANLIIYHSGINAGCGIDDTNPGGTTGCAGEDIPYDPSDPNPTGVNQLIRSLEDSGIGPNENVFAEMGTSWVLVSGNTTAAQHYMGKLLKFVGENNIIWGTDSILLGSPQFQIDSFRAFQITQQFQDQFGYPALTPEIKAGIFGRNAARIFRIDPDKARCQADASMFQLAKNHFDAELGGRRWAVRGPRGPQNKREFVRYARESIAANRPG